MATPQIKSLSQINSALDSMTQIMTGGAAKLGRFWGCLPRRPGYLEHRLWQAPTPGVSGAPTATAERFAIFFLKKKKKKDKILGQGPFTTPARDRMAGIHQPADGAHGSLASEHGSAADFHDNRRLVRTSGRPARRIRAEAVKQAV